MNDVAEKKKAGGFNPIGWCHFTLNFWWGCTKVSEACKFCYAETQSTVRSKMFFGFKVEWGPGKARGERLEKARIEAQALDRQAKKKGVRYRVFVNSMSDWLDDEVPIEWLAFLLETVWVCRSLDFQLLTKRPGNWRSRVEDVARWDIVNSAILAEHWLSGDPPENVWIGTTVENQEWADKRVPELLKIPAKVRFLSCEPLLGPVDLTFVGGDQVSTPYYLRGNFWEVACENSCSFAGREDDLIPDPEQSELDAEQQGTTWVCPECHADSGLVGRRGDYPKIHQVIAGGESGGHARPSHPGWFRSLRDQCAAAGVPFYFKQWGEWVPVADHPAKELPVTHRAQRLDDGTLMLRAGKKLAGDALEGQEWKQFPAIGGAVRG